MKRNRFFLLSLVGFPLLVIAVLALRSVVRADLPQSTATQIYQPAFEDWAFVNLMASYRDSGSQTHFVSVGRESVKGKTRFRIVGSYTRDPLGQAWYDKVGSKIRQSIEADCKRWTAEGFPIDLNDFEIDITPAKDKPQ